MDIEDWCSAVGLYQNPFRDAEWIDPSIYVSRTNSALLRETITSTKNRECQIMLITGPHGIGKGAFKHAFELALRNTRDIVIKTFTVKQPNFTEIQFYRAVGDELGLDFEKYLRDRLEVRRKLTGRITNETNNKYLLLIVDDAHYITAEALHAVKYITDIETSGMKCCTALLLATDKILKILDKDGLRQVADRIHLRRNLKPFEQRDTLEYIARAVAYANENPLSSNYEFPDTPKEIQREGKRLAPFEVMSGIRIHGLTGGTPRYVRLLCSEAIKVGARMAERRPQLEKFIINPSVIQLAWRSLLRKGEIPLS